MKKGREKITIILCLLLAVLCSSSALVTRHVKSSMLQLAEQAIAMDIRDDIPDSEAEKIKPILQSIVTRWETYEPIISTYSRHDEAERVTSAVQKLRPLWDTRQFTELHMTLHELSDALEHLQKTESPSIANIL